MTRLTSFPFHPAQREHCHFRVVENLELSLGTSFSQSKSTKAASISPPNQIEVTVHEAFEQHPTAQMNDHGSINSTNAHVDEKPSVWSLGDDVVILERRL
jgi:hypothetical protein